jgi:cbb3-type cytochrome oxidase maturation protein
MSQSTAALIILALCLGFAAWLGFTWAAKKGEFEDVEEPKYRMLEDDDEPISDEHSVVGRKKENGKREKG